MSDEDDDPGVDNCFEDDDEERTLSTDTYLNEIVDSQQVMMEPPPPAQEIIIPADDNLMTAGPKKPNPMILNLANKFDKLLNNPSTTPLAEEAERRPPSAPVAKKLKSPSHISRIQKQISLYERDKTSEPDQPHHRPVMRQRSHHSVERMESISFLNSPSLTTINNNNHTKPVALSSAAALPSKTKSCANLKHCYAMGNNIANTSATITTTPSPSTPTSGALIVKENFIEPPKRVTKSFHGRTDLSSKEAVADGGSSKQRFKTIPVQEGSFSAAGDVSGGGKQEL